MIGHENHYILPVKCQVFIVTPPGATICRTSRHSDEVFEAAVSSAASQLSNVLGRVPKARGASAASLLWRQGHSLYLSSKDNDECEGDTEMNR